MLDQATLRASELGYRRLFEAGQDGILILDAETGRIKDANPFLASLLGYTHDEMVGRTVAEMSPSRDGDLQRDMLEQLKREEYGRHENLPLLTRDGREIAVEFVSNVYQAGELRLIRCNIRDITERNRGEEQLGVLRAELEQRVVDRTSDLLAANEALAAFSYSVSHDLRAPLRHVLGFLELLQKEAGASLSPRAMSHMATISQAVGRMGTLIDDLLSFSRVGVVEIHPAEVPLGDLARETMLDFQNETDARNIEWKIGPLPTARCDRPLIRLALVNLFSNAVKFTSRSEKAVIEVGSRPGGDNEIVVFVRDNGAGFDPRYAHKLFGVFQRLHSTAEFEGTGIGLANVQRIIERHRGRTWAEGAVNGGATFYFSLPTEMESA
jgi:PAS domain S-box-containing protein